MRAGWVTISARTTDSTALSMTVAMMLNEPGGDPRKISIAGYAQYHPSASNDTPEVRQANRAGGHCGCLYNQSTTGKSATH
jgi:hypothetical protein